MDMASDMSEYQVPCERFIGGNCSPSDQDIPSNEAESKNAKSAIQIRSDLLAAKCLKLATLFAFITPVKAMDGTRCCLLRARELLSVFADDPWTVCGVNVTSVAGVSVINPTVNSTIGWCENQCPGIQLSSLNEWLTPLATWMAPYAALMLLCPIGEQKEDTKERKGRHWIVEMRKFLRSVLYAANAYIHILGDPASAIWGAFSQLEANAWVVRSVKKRIKEPSYERLDINLVGMVLTCGQTEFDGENWMVGLIYNGLLVITEHSRVPNSPEAEKSQPTSDASSPHLIKLHKYLKEEKPAVLNLLRSRLDKENDHSMLNLARSVRKSLLVDRDVKSTIEACLNDFKTLLNGKIEGNTESEEQVGSSSTLGATATALDELLGDCLKDPNSKEFQNYGHNSGRVTESLNYAIQTIRQAKVNFIEGIILPVVLTLAVTGSVFFNAYNTLGDNDTAHSLAYGVLYSWLLILVVVGNCYVANVNVGLVRMTIGTALDVSGSTVVPLRCRYIHATKWAAWLKYIGADAEPTQPQITGTDSYGISPAKSVKTRNFYTKFILGQLAGWLCICVSSICAAIISFTTPTIGLGCRSFNQILYGIFAFVIAVGRVACHWADQNRRMRRTNRKNPVFWNPRTWDMESGIRGTYVFLVYVNAVILLLGTALNIAGVYRSCRCMVLFKNTDFIVKLSPMTQLDIDMATKYWLSNGYVAFTFAWAICVVAVALKAYIDVYVGLVWPEDSVKEDFQTHIETHTVNPKAQQ